MLSATAQSLFDKIANSDLAKCFITVDGQPLTPNSIFFIKMDAAWATVKQSFWGTNGMPDGIPTMFKLNLEHRLAVGTDGTFISLRRGALGASEPRQLVVQDNGEGYMYVSGCRASRIVYETWHGPIPAGLEIDHLNHQRGDDRLENLRVVTHSENLKNRLPYKRTPWEATDTVLLIPSVAGDPVLVHPAKAYGIVPGDNVWKLLHGRRSCAGWFAILNPTARAVRGHFKAYASRLNRDGLMDECLALLPQKGVA